MKIIVIACLTAAVAAAAPAVLAQPVVKQTPRHEMHHKLSKRGHAHVSGHALKHKMRRAKAIKRSYPGDLGRARSEPKDYSTGSSSNAGGGGGGGY